MKSPPDNKQNIYGIDHKRRTKISSRRTDDIDVLLERLGSLQITNKASEEYKQSDTEILTAPAPTMNNEQTTMLKSMVPDPGWFNRNRTKFEDW